MPSRQPYVWERNRSRADEAPKDKLLTVRMVADRLSCSVEWVYRLIDRGVDADGLPLVKVGLTRGGFRVPESAVKTFIEKRTNLPD